MYRNRSTQAPPRKGDSQHFLLGYPGSSAPPPGEVKKQYLAFAPARVQTLISVGATSGNRLAAYLHAEKRLERAHADLDDMMQSVPTGKAEDASGRPGLLLLLVRAVAARRHLNDVGAALELDRGR